MIATLFASTMLAGPGAEPAPGEDEALLPLPPAPRASAFALADDLGIERIVIKFHEGTRVRVVGGSLVAPVTRSPRENEDMAALGLTEAQVEADLAAVFSLVQSEGRVTVLDVLFETDPEVLDERKKEAEAAERQKYQDLNLYSELNLVADTRWGDVEGLLDALDQLPSVEVAYAEPPVADAGFVGEGTGNAPPDLEASQGYLDAAPAGVDARYAWTRTGGTGDGVKIVDVEQGWNPDHEDLPALFLQSGSNRSSSRNHGTAVLGELAALRNGAYVTGISHGAQIGYSSTESSAAVASAITTASIAAGPGGLVLIEVHLPGPERPDGETCGCSGEQCDYIPVEFWPANFNAIALASALGTIVVEAGGNGFADLDESRYEDGNGHNLFDRTFRDSKAIVVGASESASRDATCFSNYGSRIDVHAWGWNVTTLGYGLRAPSSDVCDRVDPPPPAASGCAAGAPDLFAPNLDLSRSDTLAGESFDYCFDLHNGGDIPVTQSYDIDVYLSKTGSIGGDCITALNGAPAVGSSDCILVRRQTYDLDVPACGLRRFPFGRVRMPSEMPPDWLDDSHEVVVRLDAAGDVPESDEANNDVSSSIFVLDENKLYTHSFSGTSAASPIVTGAAAAIQGRAMARGFGALGSRTMRELLVATGTPSPDPIGPMPDLQAAFLRLDTHHGEQDLVIEDIALSSSFVIPEESLVVAYDVVNQASNTVVDAYREKVWLSTDAVLDEEVDVPLGTTPANSTVLQPFGRTRVSISVAYPPGTPFDEDRYVLVQADAAHNVLETNTAGTAESNNVTEAFLRAGGQDLAIENLTLSSAMVATGTTFTVHYDVVNLGSLPVTVDYDEHVYLTSDPGSPGSPVATGGPHSEDLGRLGGRLAVTLDVSAAVAPGSYYVVVEADGSGTVAEIDTDNNLAVVPVTITDEPDCSAPPTFAGLESLTPPAGACELRLDWSPATSACGAPVRYHVYRASHSGVDANAGFLLASNLDATSFTDAAVVPNGRLYYLVRSVDTVSGQEDGNLARLWATPDCGASGTFFTASDGLNPQDPVNPGTQVFLSWNISGATDVFLVGLGSFPGSSGMVAVEPEVTTIYTAFANDAEFTVRVHVSELDQPQRLGPCLRPCTDAEEIDGVLHYCRGLENPDARQDPVWISVADWEAFVGSAANPASDYCFEATCGDGSFAPQRYHPPGSLPAAWTSQPPGEIAGDGWDNDCDGLIDE